MPKMMKTTKIKMRSKIAAKHRYKLHILSGEDESNICDQTEQGIVLLRLINGVDFIRKPPEQQRHHDATPQLREHVEHSKSPVADLAVDHVLVFHVPVDQPRPATPSARPVVAS